MMESRPRILIVDDEKIVCDMAKRWFEHEGYDVTALTESTKAMEVLQNEFFHVLIADLKMKEIDGMRLLEFTQERWPETKVIMLTAFATMETAVEALRKRAFDYFSKPVRFKELKAAIERALQQRNSTEQERSDEQS